MKYTKTIREFNEDLLNILNYSFLSIMALRIAIKLLENPEDDVRQARLVTILTEKYSPLSTNYHIYVYNEREFSRRERSRLMNELVVKV